MTPEERDRIRVQISHEISVLEKAKQRIAIMRNVLSKVLTPAFGICIKYNKPIPF
jgi:RNA polymerase-binding transcription factor DksA